MAFGKEKKPCRVYEYGCFPPTVGEAEAVEQMWRRVQFWNRLVAIEHTHQERISGEAPIQAARAVIDALSKDAPEAERKLAWRAYYDAYNVADRAFGPDRIAAVKIAQAESGLWWCNYDDVKHSYDVARRPKKGQGVRPLKFHSWRNAVGKVSVRFQQGLPIAEAFGDDTRLQLEWLRGNRSRSGCAVLRLRVGSDDKLSPIWLQCPIVLHRPIPDGAVIRGAAILRERIGTRYRWKAVIVVDLAPASVVRAAPPTGRIGIDLGWRKRPGGVRVAYWQDDQGQSGEVLLSQSWLDQMAKVKDLEAGEDEDSVRAQRSIRDRHFNAARSVLQTWLAEHTAPDWLKEETATIAHWRRSGRLATLVMRWRGERFAGDETIYPELETWRKREKHLYEYEANLRDQLLAHREYEYRQFAAKIAHTYREVVIEDFDLRKVSQVKDGGQGKDLPPMARRYRFFAAPSTFRQAVRNAVLREGGNITEVDATNTTRMCHHCGTIESDRIVELEHRCSECRRLWDQDQNAAQNLLDLHEDQENPPGKEAA